MPDREINRLAPKDRQVEDCLKYGKKDREGVQDPPKLILSHFVIILGQNKTQGAHNNTSKAYGKVSETSKDSVKLLVDDFQDTLGTDHVEHTASVPNDKTTKQDCGKGKDKRNSHAHQHDDVHDESGASSAKVDDGSAGH